MKKTNITFSKYFSHWKKNLCLDLYFFLFEFFKLILSWSFWFFAYSNDAKNLDTYIIFVFVILLSICNNCVFCVSLVSIKLKVSFSFKLPPKYLNHFFCNFSWRFVMFGIFSQFENFLNFFSGSFYGIKNSDNIG